VKVVSINRRLVHLSVFGDFLVLSNAWDEPRKRDTLLNAGFRDSEAGIFDKSVSCEILM
jgi:hypothetical protein